MFLQTLDISVFYTLHKLAKAGGMAFSIYDMRCRREPHNKTSQELKQLKVCTDK